MNEDIGEVVRWSSISELVTCHKESEFVVCSVGHKTLEGFPKSSFILNSKSNLPIEVNYDTPGTLGMDRLAGSVGSWQLFPQSDLLIIDGGSCITYDLVTKEGVFEGGMISPGLDMRFRAMHEFTNGLPLAKSGDAVFPGKSTEQCLQIGAEQGLKMEIEGFLQSFNKKLPNLQIVTTGGFLPSFDTNTKKPIFASSKIVLRGLHAIWKFNEGT